MLILQVQRLPRYRMLLCELKVVTEGLVHSLHTVRLVPRFDLIGFLDLEVELVLRTRAAYQRASNSGVMFLSPKTNSGTGKYIRRINS